MPAQLRAALELLDEGKIEPTAPTIDLSHLTPSQRRAYILADNKLAEEATWALPLLKAELAGLHFAGFDGDKLNNRADNLRWATRQENARNGQPAFGHRAHPTARLTVDPGRAISMESSPLRDFTA